MVEVIPAIIPDNLEEIKNRFSKVLHLTKKVQVDIADGLYTTRITWPFKAEQKESFQKMIFDREVILFSEDFVVQLDMLVLDPIKYIADFASIGFKSFVIHIDSTENLNEAIEKLRELKCEVGIGIKPSIDTKKLDEFLDKIDFIQFMGNDRVGYNGVELDPKCIEKIKNFHEANPQMPVQVDIGVNFETAPKLIDVGVSKLISGSAIFNAPNIKDAIMKLSTY